MKKIFLIRHGQTAWNKEEVFRGLADIPLDEVGRMQARSLGAELTGRLQGTPLFLSSPLQRARETAAIAAEHFPESRLQVEEGFTDINFGRWQGVSKAEVRRTYPELYRQWLENPAEAVFPEGENLQAVENRAGQALREAAEKKAGAIVIVSHRVVTKVLLCLVLQAGLNAFWKIKQDTACLNILEWYGSAFSIKTMNDTCHLKKMPQQDAADF